MKLPTMMWLEDIQAGEEDLFNPQAIEETQEALLRFRSDLRTCKELESARDVVHRLVLVLNEIGGMNGRFPNMFETDEREQLCAFIDHEIDECGFAFDGDITESWREW